MSYLQTTLVKALHIRHVAETTSQPAHEKAIEIYGASSAVAEMIQGNLKNIFNNSGLPDYAAVQASSQFINLAKETSIIGAIESTGKPVIHMPIDESLIGLELAPVQPVAQAYPTQTLSDEQQEFTLVPHKLGGFIVVSDRFLSDHYFPKVEPLINQALLSSYVRGENLDFVAMVSSDALTVASTSSFKADLANALASMDNPANAIILMNPATALTESINLNNPADSLGVLGGFIAGVPVIADIAVPVGKKIVIDASRLVIASNAVVDIRLTNEAMVSDLVGQPIHLFQQNKAAFMILATTGYSFLAGYQPIIIGD